MSFFVRQLVQFFSIACAAALLGGCQTASLLDSNSTGSSSPGTTSIDGPLSDDEAVSIALANNHGFQELLSDLDISEAERIQASQLTNPTLAVLFPLGPKQLEFSSKFPVEALWLRPEREAAAKLNTDAVIHRLEQDGLNLSRDVKIACTDLRLAERRVELTKADAELLERLAKLADARLQAGDISELELNSAEADSLRGRIDRERAHGDVTAAREKLRNLLGLSLSESAAALSLSPAPQLKPLREDDDALVQRALAARPDLRAAEVAIESEGRRVGLAKKEIWALTAVFDANGDASNFEAGPGLELALPIFHQNQGARALADARFRKATHRYAALRDQIAMEVRQASARYRQATKNHQSLRDELLPALEQGIEQAERAWSGGEVPYLFVLEASRRVQEGRAREVEAEATSQQAAAELERSLGSPLTSGK